MKFAVMSDNLVTNIIVADTLEIAEDVSGQTCILCTDENPAGINWTYNGTNFINPNPKPEEVTE
jgi:hypothetical protein